jgi:hypothetical protein
MDENDPAYIHAQFKAFQVKPTIEEYVRLRKTYPGFSQGIETTGGLEFVFAQQKQLRAAGLDPEVVAAALDDDERAQGQLSFQLLEKLLERKGLEKSGHSHVVSRKKGISDSLVNYLIGNMLDALDAAGGFVVSDLIVLIKYQLGVIESEFEIKLRAHERRKAAVWIAAQMVANGEVPSYRSVARELGVEPSTVMRWFAGKDMIKEAKAIAALIKNLKILRKKRTIAR